MNGKYNSILFLNGFLMNLIAKFPLLLIALVLALIGIRIKVCGAIAATVFLLALIWSLIQQLQIKYTVENSDNPNFTPYAKAMMSDNWKDAIEKVLEGDKPDKDEHHTQE